MTDRIWLISRCSVSNTLMTRMGSAPSCGWEAVRRSEPRGTRTIGFMAMRTMETEGHGGCKLQLRIRRQTSDSKSKQHLWRASRDELHFTCPATIPRHTHDAWRMLCGYSRWIPVLLDECRGCRELGRWIKRNSNRRSKSSRQARVHMFVDSIASMGSILLKHFSAARMQCPSHK